MGNPTISNRVSKYINSHEFKEIYESSEKRKIEIFSHNNKIKLEQGVECNDIETDNWMYFKTEDGLIHTRKEHIEYIKYYNEKDNGIDKTKLKSIKINTISFEIIFIGVYLFENGNYHVYSDMNNNIYYIKKDKIIFVFEQNLYLKG